MVGCENKYLTFRLGEETYALPICPIAEIIRMVPITKVPKTKAFIMGVINLRGEIIPVMDGKKRLHLKSEPYDDRTCIIIIQVSHYEIGFIVDNVEEVIFMEPETIKQMDLSYLPHQDSAIRGISKIGEGIKIVLNYERLFNNLEEEDL